MIQLRAWQSECIYQALETFKYQTHFLCHATPGAGKTVMVASVAKALLEDDRVDSICELWFNLLDLTQRVMNLE